MIRVPYIRRLTPSNEKQRSLLKHAKEGLPSAVKELDKMKSKVWKYEEIDALNYYLSIRDSLTKDGRVSYPVRISLNRLTKGFKVKEGVDVLWVQDLDKGYYLLCGQYDDGVITLWMCEYTGRRFTPLCDVTEWSEFKVQ